MASISKHRQQWQARVQVRGQHAARSFKHLADAREWATDMERAFKAGASSTAGLRTLMSEVVTLYLDDLARSDAKDKAEPTRLAQWWNARIGTMRLGDVSPAVIDRHLRPLRSKSAQTFNHYLSAVSRLFRCAADAHLVRDVDLTAGTALLRDTKNGDDRKVALPSYLVARLREHLRVRDLSDDRVLRVTKMQLDHAWRMIRAAAGLSWRPRFHDLRHSAVTRFAKSGATLEQLKAASGHRSAAMVLKYMHSDEPPAELIERAAIGD